jgi:hypothetical protein
MLVGDVTSLLNPSTELDEFVTAFDPNAIADVASLLTADLAPNASGWVVDLFSACEIRRPRVGVASGAYSATAAQPPRMVVEAKLAALARWLSVGV